MSKQVCHNCRFFEAQDGVEIGANGDYWLESGNGVPNGRCLFNPPTVNQDGYSVRPRVTAKDWCGQWRSVIDEEAIVLKSGGLSISALNTLASMARDDD